MKRQERSIKKQIKKRIEVKQNIKMRERDKIRRGGKPSQSVRAGSFSRGEIRRGENRYLNTVNTVNSVNTVIPLYQKKVFVDYDVVICIPSHERYEKIKRLIAQFYEQPTKYTFKIILLNDGSKSQWYDKLPEQFPEIIYLKNEKANGKNLHWYCYSQMWEHIKDIECHTVLQTDDDFILSDNFLDTIVDLFFNVKEKNSRVLAITPHLWSGEEISEDEKWWHNDYYNKLKGNYKILVDGIALIDDAVIKKMNYEMQPVERKKIEVKGGSAFAWSQVGEEIKKMGGTVYRTENSLVFHDGNDDSKLHGEHRGKEGHKVFTQKYIGKL